MRRMFFTIAFIISSITLLFFTQIPALTTQPIQTASFSYTFDKNGILEESESPQKSTSPYWWLNSGGEMILFDGRGSTIIGDTPIYNKWRLLYQKTNPKDTDNGIHPQNIFRLITKQQWKNSTQSVQMRIKHIYESTSENRNESNGILLLGRYTDSDNLYYAGLRVDGSVAIKKKKNGIYTLLALQPFFTSSTPYNKKITPNLLPLHTWVNLKMQIKDVENGVEIILFVKVASTEEWKEVLRAVDNTDPITEAGSSGIRSDFMDIEFDNFFVETIFSSSTKNMH